MTKRYRPSNGTAGEIFMSAFCFQCKHDDGCPIAMRSIAFDIDHPDYPDEWRYGKDGAPECSAFRHEDDDREYTEPQHRCSNTDDLFGGTQ